MRETWWEGSAYHLLPRQFLCVYCAENRSERERVPRKAFGISTFLALPSLSLFQRNSVTLYSNPPLSSLLMQTTYEEGTACVSGIPLYSCEETTIPQVGLIIPVYPRNLPSKPRPHSPTRSDRLFLISISHLSISLVS